MPSTIYSQVHGDIRPLPDDIIVYDMEKGDKLTKGGLIILDDNGKDRGIRPRFAKIYKVGSNVDYVSPGEIVLIKHGFWTYGIDLVQDDSKPDDTIYIQKIDPEAILLVMDKDFQY